MYKRQIKTYANSLNTTISGSNNVTAGSKFTVTFAINNTKDVQGIQTRINFNSSHFSIVNPTNLISNSSGGSLHQTTRIMQVGPNTDQEICHF